MGIDYQTHRRGINDKLFVFDLRIILATRRATSKNSPSLNFKILALCTAVTFFRLYFFAISKANLTMRSEQRSVMTRRLSHHAFDHAMFETAV